MTQGLIKLLTGLSELFLGHFDLEAMYNLMVVDGGDKAAGQGLDLIKVKVWLPIQDVEGRLWRDGRTSDWSINEVEGSSGGWCKVPQHSGLGTAICGHVTSHAI